MNQNASTPGPHASQQPKDQESCEQRALLYRIQMLSLSQMQTLMNVVTDIYQMLDEGHSESEILQYIKRTYPFLD